MRWLTVFLIQLFYFIFKNIQLVEPYVLNGFGLSRDSATSRLEYVDNLLQELFDTVTSKKLELEDPNKWPQDFANEYLQHGPMVFHYIIVGAGTAGSIVASRLSENPRVNVLLLEAGGDPPIQSEIHPLSLQLLNTRYTWSDYAEPNPSCCQAMKEERCYWPRGRMIGGTGALNGNIFLTGYAEDFDEWQQQGNDGWSWNDVYPFYEKATKQLGSEHWPLGSLTLNYFQRLDNYNILEDIMVNATNEVEKCLKTKSPGYKKNILATVDRGIRMSTGKTYLGKVSLKRHNLFVIKNSVVTKILFQNGNTAATGVEFLLNDKYLLKARASKEIIISAGTFNTPKLLLLSGVGPKDHLKSLNISVVKDLQVGANLQDHGMMPLVLKFNKNIPETSDDVTADSLYEYLMFQKGPLASSPTLIGFLNTLGKTKPQHEADLMLVTHLSKPTRDSNVFDFLQFKEDFVQKFLQQLENQTILEIEGLIIKPKSRGFVKLRSKDPLQGPFIHNNMAVAKEDQQTLLSFVRLIQKLQRTNAFKYYGLELITLPIDECDQFYYDSNDYWLCYIKYFYISAWHAAGTCRMGPSSDPSAVLDERLRVHGINGLRVIDASIMPNITSGNTNGPTIMIAERASQLIKEDWYT